MLDEEIEHAKNGEEAYFSAKVNSISDRDVMDKLAEASQAGVKIELVVRGICCLKAGVKGYTDNIRIVSIVGRYLEHSRIYLFGTPERRRIYISSADFMTRNTMHRVEVAAPILDEKLKDRVAAMLALCLSDNVKGREGMPDGSFRHLQCAAGETPVNAQETLYAQACDAAQDKKS